MSDPNVSDPRKLAPLAPSTVSSPLPEPSSEPELLRALGLGVAIAIVVGNVIGAGIFAKPSRIAVDSGNFPLILTGWIAGGVICLFGALCFAELSAMLPRAGGLYIFLREAFGKPVAFLFGLNEYVFGRTATNGALAVYFASLFCSQLLPPGNVPGPWLIAFVACLVIAGLTAINVFGIIWGGAVQGLTTLIKAGFLALIGLTPFVMSLGYPSLVEFTNYSTTIVPRLSTVSEQFAAILLAVMWAYNGWHDVAPVAEEVRDPQRNIPRALIWGTLSLIVLYVGANLAYHGVLTMAEVAASEGETARLTIEKVLAPLGDRWSKLGGYAVTLVTMCSVFGALNCNLMLGPRVAFAMARDGVFWRRLATVHPRFRTPAVSILFQAVMSCGLVLIGTTLLVTVESLKDVNLFDLFTNFVVYSANIFYALCVLGVYVLRIRHPEWDRPYKTWGYPVVPALYLLGMGWFLVVAFQAASFASGVAVFLMLLGVPIYMLLSVWGRANSRTATLPPERS